MEITTLTHCPHSQKVSEISGLLAVYAGLPPDTAELIRQAALYHDIGKSAIDPAILNKPGRLTDDEYEIVKTHTRLGTQEITHALKILMAARTIAAQHHEKMDGNGYLGLCGDEIHPFSRIVAVADVYDALASKRPYKEAWDAGEILGYMEAQSGVQFDRAIVGLLLAHSGEIMALYQ